LTIVPTIAPANPLPILDKGCTIVLPMAARTFQPRQVLLHLYGTRPFIDYCGSRHIAFKQIEGFLMTDADYARWFDALKTLPDADQARIASELIQVNDLARPGALNLLTAAIDGEALPVENVPAEAPLSLWFFLRHPALFHEVLLQEELAEIHAWRTAKAKPGLMIEDLSRAEIKLRSSLRSFFRSHEGTGRYCTVESHALQRCYSFVAHVSDRFRLLDVFDDDGRHTVRAARPAFAVHFAYYPADGRILLKTRRRAATILGLLRCFGRAVLGQELNQEAFEPAYRLDVLKSPFEPLLDAEDMELVRVRALHLVYPARSGRRRLKLETLSMDRSTAIVELLRAHGGGKRTLEHLDVAYAELLLKLRHDGVTRSHVVRLWPDRSSLDHSPLGERLYDCLRRWGIAYAKER
jgi:hypothetical protein